MAYKDPYEAAKGYWNFASYTYEKHLLTMADTKLVVKEAGMTNDEAQAQKW